MSAPDYPSAVTGYAPSAETFAYLRGRLEEAEMLGLPITAEVYRIAMAVAEANLRADDLAHWSRELAAPRPVEEPLRHLSAATRAECAKVYAKHAAATEADAEPLARIGQGDCERTIPAK